MKHNHWDRHIFIKKIQFHFFFNKLKIEKKNFKKAQMTSIILYNSLANFIYIPANLKRSEVGCAIFFL